MSATNRIVLVSGLADGAHLAALRAELGGAGVLFAAPPGVASADDVLDLTAIVSEDELSAACGGARPEQLALVRDHQLGFSRNVEALNRASMRCVVLYPHASYDADPSWVEAALAEMTAKVRVEHFALDLFCDVEGSWDLFANGTEESELGPEDVRRICAQFPCLLTADVEPGNARDIASFPGARGLLLSCADLVPHLPAERHVIPFETLRPILATLRDMV